MGNDLTLEKLKIDERLREVELAMAEAKPIREQIAKSLEKLESFVESIDNTINGNPDTGKIGLEKRLERIEAAEEDRKKSVGVVIKIAVGALTMSVGAAVMWLFKLIKIGLLGG